MHWSDVMAQRLAQPGLARKMGVQRHHVRTVWEGPRCCGGSYDTGKEIAVLFGHEPPAPLTYEWISLRGKGAMSSSSGNTVGPIEALRLVPPEILRFLVANSKPSKAIEFDTGMGLVNLADEYELSLIHI